MHSKEADGCRLCRYRRVQEKRPDRDCLNGEVTVYLTLTFVLFVSLILALVESASVQMAKNYRRADMNRALECVFAEYQKELLENYDVFAIECGYETGTYTEQNILDRLSYYGADMENEIERIQLFTDNSGELFRDQVGKYMKHKYGIAWADKYLGNVSLWKNQEEKADEFTEEEEKQNDQLKDLLGEQEAELPEEEKALGDIVINVDRAVEQAKEYGHSTEREMAYLAVHGFLHILGYDHYDPEEKKAMRKAEEEILGACGLQRVITENRVEND